MILIIIFIHDYSMIIWLMVWNMNFSFPYIGNNNPNWLSYFSEGVKTPTRPYFTFIIIIYQNGHGNSGFDHYHHYSPRIILWNMHISILSHIAIFTIWPYYIWDDIQYYPYPYSILTIFNIISLYYHYHWSLSPLLSHEY